MAETLQNSSAWAHGYDLSGVASAIALDYSAEPLDATVMTDDTRQFVGGLKMAAAQIEGFFDPTTLDEALFTRIGLTGAPLTICPIKPPAVGSRAFSFKARQGQYDPAAARVGELLRFAAGFDGGGSPLVRGQIAQVGSVSGAGQAAGVQLGAIGATQKLYAALHVLSITGGGALTVTIGSDNGSGFPSETDQATFAAANAVGSEWLAPVSGPITDDWWRAKWTLTGTTPTAQFVVFFGIL